MIGAVVYKLIAENEASLIELHGKLLHGALFAMIKEIDPNASQRIHNNVGGKGFSAGLLEPENKKERKSELTIKPDEKYKWRVCALRDDVLELLISIKPNSVFKVGNAQFRIEDVVTQNRYGARLIDKRDFVGNDLNYKTIRSVSFHFLTPGTFRRDDMDYPLPTPELVFGSIAKKWIENEMPMEIDYKMIKEAATHVKPFKWEGRSIFGYTAKNCGITSFKGSFTYSLDGLDDEWRKVFFMLGKYSEFAGVGRLTGQGFGRVKFSWR